MNYQSLLARSAVDRPTRTALVGVGQFGLTLLAQSRHVADLELMVLCDPQVKRVRTACLALGWHEDDLVVTENRASAAAAFERGATVITPRHEIATGLPVDVLVEATGDIEIGARTTSAAINNGVNVVLVTKETDAVIGPILSRRAKAAGVVVSQVDGDQPSLTLALISWSRALGLDIACAGKASEYDFVLDFEQSIVRADAKEVSLDDPRALWDSSASSLVDLVNKRASLLDRIPSRTPPDFCELCLIANASGLRPDRPHLHAPIARAIELADLLRTQHDGGLFAETGRLDVFNCLRRPDEISFAGGVFVVVCTPDRKTGQLFSEKGIPVSRDGRHALVYNPTHLLGVEAAMSVLVAHRLGMATGSDDVRAVCDVAARASQDLPSGTKLAEVGKRHVLHGLDPVLIDNAPIGNGGALPYFLANGRTLKRLVRAGETIRMEDVDEPSDSLALAMRREQDEMFFPARSGS